ncbi:PPOX class probable F420-dependent enzyme [Actinoplanes octamycinicus]|uniref:PPOX class probable F420-dependent enzyme n=1 Tax=Actinoplanes octamycinicus TaxID=135948 RepID=A0A7W7MCH6_9ACTN|nr:pyridoxamine 5'-phosphate oxidase family protein [Actinoplanes octamycinicus]MBB4745172.1 PPOX class probable F420-dependent enzyme [Actinoplanes octamycinicus]GIE62701.1 PPOX class F420-dependent enzyme [Actinoplanes octamycinicus]
MKQRDTVSMPASEVASLLAAGRKLQLATINPDGTPHLVSMFYAMVDERIAFWTYRASQKARNLARDPRVTCLVEDGDDYFELRGVQVTGVVTVIDDLAGVTSVGRLIAASMPGPAVGGLPPDQVAAALDGYVAHAATKRVAYLVEPRRVISWDHRRLIA